MLNLATAQALLEAYNCSEPPQIATPEEQMQLQQALQVVVKESDRQIFGVCADSLTDGLEGLASYLQALDQQADLQFDPLAGPVYLKFNPSTGRCYRDAYTGPHRGVLVSCQSDFEQGVNDTYGHLPLDLFSASLTAKP
ncbi:MAG: DUF1824 family protein [Aphanocapsa sp. GSE-SYN-MK-11-07L]|jgi:hypothetical protein|nr:DUF1824 family protein [Aphanocapsa sp. GSE-SYN-MK-11-07L]